MKRFWMALACTAAISLNSAAQTSAVPVGELMGRADRHTEASLRAALDNAWLVLPASATGGAVWSGLAKNAPTPQRRVPVVVFAHGSSGIAPAIKEWQLWLAQSLGVASFTPDSMQLPDRLTYKSPVAKADYERVHGLRQQELQAAASALAGAPWADAQRWVLAGTSEGAVSVARFTLPAGAAPESGRMIFSWSCEANYHVEAPASRLADTLPVLNIMSTVDPYFSQTNSYLGNPQALGHCGAALARNKLASVVLIPGAPHTLFNLPPARSAVQGFLATLWPQG